MVAPASTGVHNLIIGSSSGGNDLRGSFQTTDIVDGGSNNITLAGGNAPLHQSDIIKPRFTMPNFTGYVQADYFSSGTVYHFWPLGPAKPSQASQTLTFNNGIGQVWPPFDTDLIVVIVTPTPLFSTPRPQNEPASTYLADLNDALQNNAAFGNQASISALPVVTEP